MLKYIFSAVFFVISGALVVAVSGAMSPKVTKGLQWMRMLITFGLFGFIGFIVARIAKPK